MNRQIGWWLSWPARAYLRHSPIQRGKGFVIRRAVLPLLPSPPARFLASLPGGGRIELSYRETLGYVTLIYGGFERAELESVLSFGRLGTTVFDVGANVGIFSVVMAGAVGDHGTVIAVEPNAANVRRLRSNLKLNAVSNVQIVEAAATNREGTLRLHLAVDAAYHSLGPVKHTDGSSESVQVDALRLDQIWQDAGSPVVSLMKIDVEGAEIPALEGSVQILATHHPALLLEAGDDADLDALRAFLGPLGYRRMNQAGYMTWNHLFLWDRVG
jgi:FkbM family methyltransferase